MLHSHIGLQLQLWWHILTCAVQAGTAKQTISESMHVQVSWSWTGTASTCMPLGARAATSASVRWLHAPASTLCWVFYFYLVAAQP